MAGVDPGTGPSKPSCPSATRTTISGSSDRNRWITNSTCFPIWRRDITNGHNVRSTVFVEARSSYRTDGPEEMRPVGEVEFVQAIADASATGEYGPGQAAAGIIGRTDLKLGDRVRPVLEALQAASPNRFRGIRHSVGVGPSSRRR